MDPSFGGEVAACYARYRRGYPPAVLDALVGAFGLTVDDVVMDLGCGTGQLTLPLAGRVGAVLGVDPEPDMLVLARRAAEQRGVTNAAWMLGADRDLPAAGLVLGAAALGAVTIAVAIHWMDRAAVFRAVRPLLRPGGGVAVVTNGAPLWLQDNDWSRTAKEHLERLLGRTLAGTCQTDDAGRGRNRDALREAGYQVVEAEIGYDATLTVDELVGGLFSAMSLAELPPQARAEFADGLHEALGHTEPLTEHVQVWLQTGTV
ncbi:methyltransferase domain-containing protein [Dactylosporangium sp. NPDC049525]|uniref:class I SAM-dependent methyltransferase n=1 Tax=Dactylosporangium sp. NPDC049525 TaxID=3154730 RepID=UPI0034250506